MDTQNNKSCIICNNQVIDFIDVENNVLDNNINLKLCNNCFHIQSFENDSSKKKCFYKKFNTLQCNVDGKGTTDVLFDLICKKIESKIFQNPIKILNLNDINTHILDNIYSKYKTKYINTVSLSELFYPSFFSKHTCLKGDLVDWSFEYLKNNYEHFDIIILNSTLTFNENINKILDKCELLSHENTVIYSTNYDFLNIYSHIFLFNLNNNIKNIFTTNSLNRLCNNHDLLLKGKHKILTDNKNNFENKDLEIITNDYNNIIIYEIGFKTKLKEKSPIIIEELCNELALNLYDETIYKDISDNLRSNHILFNNIIKKYILQNYNIVLLDKTENNILGNDRIITNLKKLNNQNKYLFITFDYEHFQEIYKKVKSYKYEYGINLSKCLILDINLLISYPV